MEPMDLVSKKLLLARLIHEAYEVGYSSGYQSAIVDGLSDVRDCDAALVDGWNFTYAIKRVQKIIDLPMSDLAKAFASLRNTK